MASGARLIGYKRFSQAARSTVRRDILAEPRPAIGSDGSYMSHEPSDFPPWLLLLGEFGRYHTLQRLFGGQSQKIRRIFQAMIFPFFQRDCDLIFSRFSFGLCASLFFCFGCHSAGISDTDCPRCQATKSKPSPRI